VDKASWDADLLFWRATPDGFGLLERECDRLGVAGDLDIRAGVVGADLPCKYDRLCSGGKIRESGMASGSVKGNLEVSGARERWLRFVAERFFRRAWLAC
jgi:hypothetical protein